MELRTNKDLKEIFIEKEEPSTQHITTKKRKPDAELPVQPKPKPVVK